ncbi:MAG: hypothetical protein BWY81_00474 [Firmicutes bacterium ADurb.Bin467]|nr:MAG: hypothetical protein BWY81_00474 [Firmicutes bacterium ADurb.Bin467]
MDRHPLPRDDHQRRVLRRPHDAQQPVPVAKRQRGVLRLADVEVQDRHPLDQPSGGRERGLARPVAGVQHPHELLVLRKPRQDAPQRQPPVLRPALRHLRNRHRVAVSEVGEEQEPLVGHRVDHALRRLRALERLFERPAREAPNEARAGHDDGRLVRDRSLLVDHDLVERPDEPRAPRVLELLANLRELPLDDLHQLLLALQNLHKPPDQPLDLLVLAPERKDLEARQPLQTHVEYRLRLNLRQRKPPNEPLARLLRGLARADQPDDLVEVVDGYDQPLEDVRARLGLLQLEARAARDDLLLVADVVRNDVLEPQLHGLPMRDRDHVDTERHLQV